MNIIQMPQATSYTLLEGLRDLPPSPNIYRAAPNEAAREELLLSKLGSLGWGRVHQFRYYYDQGWGECSRPPLSPKALDVFFVFLEAVSFPSQCKRPSVFLTNSGGLELVWEDESGKSIQVEFRAEDAEYYRASSNEEGVVAFNTMNDLKSLAHHLST